MNLVIQGAQLPYLLVTTLQALTQAAQVERISDSVFRLSQLARHLGNSEAANQDVAQLCAGYQVDYAWVPGERRLADFGLYVTDMDSTLITVECIDEIADMQGLKAQVAEITEAAMQGELDFRESLVRRVALLEGLPEQELETVYRERVRLTPGAEDLLKAVKAHGLKTMLVSGGFTYFTERLKETYGFDYAYANQLEVKNGRLTGRVIGDIVDAVRKRDLLEQHRQALGLRADQVIATGDGANDLPMLQAAGVGIAFHAKPVLRGLATHAINYGGLDAALHFFN